MLLDEDEKAFVLFAPVLFHKPEPTPQVRRERRIPPITRESFEAAGQELSHLMLLQRNIKRAFAGHERGTVVHHRRTLPPVFALAETHHPLPHEVRAAGATVRKKFLLRKPGEEESFLARVVRAHVVDGALEQRRVHAFRAPIQHAREADHIRPDALVLRPQLFDFGEKSVFIH